MKLCELKEVSILEDAEIESVLRESISSEMADLVASGVTNPLRAYHASLVDKFAKTLKVWAMTALQDLKKSADFDESKTYTKTLEKIINNPAGVAKQLIAKSITQIAAA